MPRDPLQEWAELVRVTREYHRLSQPAFGLLLGVTGQTVSNWERQIHLPPKRYRQVLMRMHAQADAAQTTEEDGAAV